MNKVFLVLIGSIVTAGLITVIGAWLLDLPKFYSLTQHGQAAFATVVSKEPENHMSIWFEYRVDGRTYKSAGRAEDIGKSFGEIQIGEDVPVYYDSSNPLSATMGRPEKYFYSSLRGVCFILVGLGGSFIVYVLKRVR
jgi:hypothetical protein